LQAQKDNALRKRDRLDAVAAVAARGDDRPRRTIKLQLG
jgi:hypothetical protein